MKKLMGIFLSLILGLTVLTGCGSSEDNHGLDPDKPIIVKFWHYYNGQQSTAINNMIDEFNDTVGKEEGIVVEAESKTDINTLYKELSASADEEVGASDMPEMFCTYTDFVYGLDKKGMIASLDDYFSEEELSKYNQDYLEEGRFDKDGSLKVFPIAKATEIMFINDTDFTNFANNADVSYEDLSSIEGLVEVSKKYYEYTDSLTPDVKNDGKAFFGRDSLSNYMFIGAKQLGEDIYSIKDGKVKINLTKETAKKLWDNYYVPYISGYFVENGRYRSDDEKTGDILAFVGSSTGATYFPKEVISNDGSTHAITAKILASPIFKDGEKYAVQQGAGVAVSKTSEKKEYACAEFLKWFTNVEQNVEFSSTSSYLPVMKSIKNYKNLKKYVDESNIKFSDTNAEAIEISLNTVNNSSLFIASPFENSNSIRNLLGDAIDNISKENREKVQNALNNGSSLEEAVATYNSDEIFNAWYNELNKSLNELTK